MKIRLISFFLVLSAIFARQTFAEPDYWRVFTANSFGIVFWQYIEPHYGATFSGQNGYNPHFLGVGGDSATCGSSAGCIANWNWWGANYHVLLVPKNGWLSQQVPWVGDRWKAWNYQATVWIN